MMRAPHRRFWIVLVALAAVAALAASRAAAQGGFGGPGGGMDSIPSTIFGGKEEQRHVSGPSLSATDELVADIRVVGNKTVTTSQVLNQLQTRVGRPFDPALVLRDVRTLNQRGWFVDVQPSYEKTPAGRVVIYTVVERPVIRYIQYLNNKHIYDRKLSKETDLQLGGPVDPYVVEEARKKIIALYRRSGFNNAQVAILEGDKPTHQGVTFDINEGQPQKIFRVVFEGAEFVTNRRLKTQVETKPPLLYVFKGFLDYDLLDADVDKLTAYYRSFGYFQARVGRIVELNDDSTWATVRFVVHEGPRYQVEDVAFYGNRVFANDSLKMLTKMQAGQPFEQTLMNGDLQQLKDLYGSQGYVFADIRAEPIFLEEPGKLRLTYNIEEGKQWRIGRIRVRIDGDTPHTRIQTAINRLSIHPGQIADTRELRASEVRLQRSQLFMVEPARGIMPKISFHIPESDAEFASAPGEVRGQSPDRTPGGETISARGQQRTTSRQQGPPLIAPPGDWARAGQSFELPTPAGFADRDDQIDIELHFGSPTAQRHEARRPPYEDNGPPPTAAAADATQPSVDYNTPYQRITTRSNAYQRIQVDRPAAPRVIVRGQNASPISTPAFPVGYGGQSVGATGPEASGIGSNGYAVQQPAVAATNTTPNLVVPVQYGAPVGGVPTNGAPLFAPPPVLPPPTQFGTPQPVGPPVQYGPGPGLPPDPNITPVTPLPTNPQLLPYNPEDLFNPRYPQPFVDLDVVVSEAQTGRLMLGVAVNSDAGLIGQILLDEQNFDWTRYPTSWSDVLDGRAWRGGGQRFRLEAAPGTEVQRYLVSFQEPYLLDYPISLGLSGSYFDRRYLEWDEQRVGGRVSLGYQWTEADVSAVLSYRGESIRITNVTGGVPELEALDAAEHGSNALHGFKLTLANDTRDSVFLATQGHYLEFGVEQVVGTFEYPRATFDARKYCLIHERPDRSGRHVLTAATQLGFSGNESGHTDFFGNVFDTPIYDRFYAGGYSTLRGWDFRGVSPIFDPGPGGLNVKVGGEFMWVSTLEYLFPLTADDMMHGVVFTDFGTVEENVTVNDFRMSAGFGLRITVPAMGPAPIALDFAWPINRVDGDDTQVFSFFMGFTR
jgi:outer membrane protein insertion porin family